MSSAVSYHDESLFCFFYYYSADCCLFSLMVYSLTDALFRVCYGLCLDVCPKPDAAIDGVFPRGLDLSVWWIQGAMME